MTVTEGARVVATAERSELSKARRRLISKLNIYIRLASERENYFRSRGLTDIAYNYRILKYILMDVKKYVKKGVKVNSRNTFILPGAIWIAKSLIRGRISIDEAADIIGATRHLAVRLFKELVFRKNLTLIIPSNLSYKDVKVYLWVDKVGYDHEGNPLYMLTMYFSFPFDISELDRRSEYEPVSILFVKKGGRYIPIKAYARVHYDLYVYDLRKLKNVEILFMRFGHTPKILASEVARVSSSNILKELLDKAWLIIGEFITELTGVKKIRIRDDVRKVHVYVSYKLPKTKNNVFRTAVHPYFVDVSL